MIEFVVVLMFMMNPGADINVENGTIYVKQSDGITNAFHIEEISKDPPYIENVDEAP